MTRSSDNRSKNRRLGPTKLFILLVLILVAAPHLRAQKHGAKEHEDLDAYTLRFDGFWLYSQPTGSFHGTTSQGLLNLQTDVHFNSYSTGGGRVDWKFTRKNHLFVGAIPTNHSKQFVLARTIVFQGQTYDVDSTASARLQTFLFTPGYQYDIIRRKQGHLGIAVQLDVFSIKGSLNAAAQTVNGVVHSAEASSSTIRAPLPVAGPDFRYYLIPNSRRLFVDGNVFGMYFFGYGNFISSYGTIGVSVNKHLNFQGGYQLASRFDINSKSNRIGLTLAQRGAEAGLEVSF